MGIRDKGKFLKYLGPAWLVMMADVDASSVITAVESGATYKYGLIWVLMLLIVPLFFIQEVSGRIGAVTGKGLGELIRERYGPRYAILASVPMAVTDILTYTVEYAGAAIGLSVFGVPPIIGLILVFTLHIIIVTGRGYGVAEPVLFVASTFLIGGFVGELILRGVEPYSPFYFSSSPEFLFLIAANIGAVIMPFMLFFQASATSEKRGTPVNVSRIETLVSATVSELIMVVIEAGSSGLDPTVNPLDASQLFSALSSLGGRELSVFFGVGIVAAAFLALVVVSMGSAWGVVEALGIPRRRAWRIYFLESVPALFLALYFTGDLLSLVLNMMVAFVFVLILPGIMMGKIASDSSVMGEHRLKGISSLLFWSSLGLIIFTGVVSAILSYV